MGRRADDTSIVVVDGVYLKLKGDAYHCYFKQGGRQFRRSTRTSDLSKAKLDALTWHQEAKRKVELGIEIEQVSFTKLKRSYLDHIKGQSKAKYHRETIERHFLPYFVRVDDVSKLRQKDVLDYVKFRRAKGEITPTPQTLNRENTVLRQLLRYAVDRDWLKSAPLIQNESEAQTRRRRRNFTIEEYRQLYRVCRSRASEFDGQPLKTRQAWQRKLLYDYVMMLANTGMRVDESKTVIWRNVDFVSGTIVLEHAGKTKSTRRILMRPTAVRALERIKSRREAYLAERSATLNPNERMLCLADGTFVASFKKGFDQLLQACGFEYGAVHERHSLTSLRHTYATLRLTTRTGKRASIRALAKQMGTSDRMIERHYGHDLIDDYRDELT